MTRKLVIFDFDMTLVNSEPLFDIGTIEFSTMKGLPYDCAKVMVGYVDPLKYDLGWGVPLDQQQAIYDELVEYTRNELFVNGRFIPELFPGVSDVLSELSRIYDMGIVTARHRDTLEYILKHYEMDHYFPHRRTLCCAAERGYPIKPAPVALYCLLRDCKHDYNDVIMVGDTTSDILMANAAGVKNIAVLWGAHSREKLKTANPTIMIDKVSDMPKAIAELFSF